MLTLWIRQLLREFDFQLVEPQQPLITESYALFRDTGLKVRVTKDVDMADME